MTNKYALIIGSTEYLDSGLSKLTAPGKDTEDFARVLRDTNTCAFDDVTVLLNQPSTSVIEAIDDFFDDKKPDDLLVLYFSGHGLRDEMGTLYLAFTNTARSRLRSTAIKSDYIREAMDQSRSRRQVVILDCCNSGAFPQGVKADIGGNMGITTAFQGYGRFVLTASDATQFAWEGDKVIGETQNSLFTHFLIKGLQGEADDNGDGRITIDELYDYTYRQISKATPKQTPTKSISRQEGEIVLRDNIRFEDIKPVPLPDELMNEIEDTRPYVREAAVQKLDKIVRGKNIGLARSAIEALEKIAVDENSTRRVAEAATKTLRAYAQATALATEPIEREVPATASTPPSSSSEIGAANPVEKPSSPPATQKRPYLIFSVIGAIGCCAIAIVASSFMSFMSPDNPMPTETRRATSTSTTTPTLTPTPTLTRTPIPTFTPMPVFLGDFNSFQEDFSDNSNDWLVGTNEGDNFIGQTRLENGMYIIESTETRKNFIAGRTFTSQKPVKNFNLSVNAKLVSGDATDVCYGIQFRNNENGYYLFEACDDQQYTISHYNRQQQDWTILQEWTTSEFITPGDWNKLGITALGDTFTFFINDNKITELVDQRETEGEIYLALSIYDTIPGSIAYDELTLQEFFYDNFSNNDNAWAESQVNSDFYVGQAKLENNVYIIESTETKKSFVAGRGQTSQEQIQDFNLSVKSRLLDGDKAQVCYGIEFRNNDNGYYLYEVCDKQQYRISHYNKQQQDWTTLQDWTNSEFIVPGDWNKLTIIALGDTFTFYINDNKVIELIDQKETGGEIYLVLSIYDAVPGSVAYDDFALLVK